MNSPHRQLLPAVLLGALAWPAGARAATMIDGGDIGGQVWTAAGSPYIVGKLNGDPIVPAGQELRIEAGATVLFSGPEDLTLLVQGTLNVNGTATAPVTLQGELGDTAIAWHGIQVARLDSAVVSAVVRITGAVIRNATVGVRIFGGDARVDRTTFENCGFGLSVAYNNNDYAFDSLAFQKNVVGFECDSCAAVKLTNAVAQGTASHAVVLHGAGAVTIINSTFDGNGRGVDIWPSRSDATATVDLVNTILSNNRAAIELDLRGGPAVLTVTHSTFWGNRDANLLVKPAASGESFVTTAGTVAPTGTGNVVADPKYLSATDLHLSASSPCVDSGRAAGAPNHDLDQSGRPIEGDGVPDTDGSTFDRGAYEFGATGGAGSGGGGAAGGGSLGSSAAGGGSGGGGAAEGGSGAAGGGGGGVAEGGDVAGGTGGLGGVGGAEGEAAGLGGMAGVGRSGASSGGGAGLENNGQTGGMIASAGNDAGVDAPTGIGDGAGGSAATPAAATEGSGCGCRLAAGSEGGTGTAVALALLGIVLARRGRRQ